MPRAVCENCGWSGRPTYYDIGDGPEWCCPNCDMCYCPTAKVGKDGLTDAERKAVDEGHRLMQDLHPGSRVVGEIRFK